MSQDLSYIKKQLEGCEEVDSIYDIKIGQIVKYITIKNNEEYFFDGGNYVKMGDNKIVLKIGSKYEYVPLIHYNKGGYTVYRTRLFVKDNSKNMKGCGKECKSNNMKRLLKTQQEIIEKMNVQLRKQHEFIIEYSKQSIV